MTWWGPCPREIAFWLIFCHSMIRSVPSRYVFKMSFVQNLMRSVPSRDCSFFITCCITSRILASGFSQENHAFWKLSLHSVRLLLRSPWTCSYFRMADVPFCFAHGRHVWTHEAHGCSWRFFLQLLMYVFSVVRSPRMWCPHDIGRDNWVWDEQETLEMMSSPHEVGEVALTEGSPCRE